MASETIQKLEPHRTLHLRGVDSAGAMGALWGTSATGFTLSGVFRDMADFAVLTLWDADDYFGHWQTTKYLPDFDFTGMLLNFDIHFSGVQPFSSCAYQWIPYRSLSYIGENGEPGTVDLLAHTNYVSGTLTSPLTVIDIVGSAPEPGDTVTVWYQNIAFQYSVPGSSSGITMNYFGGTASKVHGLTIGSAIYSFTEATGSGSSGAQIAIGLAAAAAADPNGIATRSGSSVVVTARLNTGASVSVSDGGSDSNGTGILWESTGDPSWLIATQLASQITNYSWVSGGVLLALSAIATGSAITITSAVAGLDGNAIVLYTTNSSSRLYATPAVAPLVGGVDDVTWSVSLDFSALGITSLRQAWLTFAPQLTAGTAYAATEWNVQVTNWTVTDPNSHRPLKIAGPGSVRVASRDAWVSYSGSSWIEEASNEPGGTGWYHGGFAHRASSPGDSVTISYSCESSHDVYLGTSLYSDRGIVAVTIDGAAQTNLDMFLGSAPNGPVNTRRKLNGASVAAGAHTVVLTLLSTHHACIDPTDTTPWDSNSTGYYFYFDYLEAVVAGDVHDPAVTYPTVMPATDWDTDHGYKLSPQRLVWMLDRLGFQGQLDHYIGVFFWNQRKRVGGTFPTWTVTFGGTWAADDSAFLTIGGTTIGKSVFAGDTASTIAAHFAYFINVTFTGVWASASGPALTVTCRTPSYSFTASYSKTSTAGTISATGSLTGGADSTWDIDDTVTPVLNRAATDWHTDFWNEVRLKQIAYAPAAVWNATVSFSMELVNPPDAPGHVYAQRFRDGVAVATDTGFGGLFSTQCTFNATVRAYQQEAYKEMAGLMNTAGLIPWLQFGEFVWWFISDYDAATNPSGGMAFYDADTATAAAAALGRPLAAFLTTSDAPSANSYADANFLREQINTHCAGITTVVKAAYPAAKFEVLFPYDVNYPSVVPIALTGGALLAYVNLPSEWLTKSGSSLDRMKMECLAFGATARNLTLAEQSMTLPVTPPLTWAVADTAYLIPLFNGGCPWTLEYLATLANAVPLVNLWAFDHVCLMSWPVPLPVPGAAAF